MHRLYASFAHALHLLWSLGARKFTIILILWVHRRYPALALPARRDPSRDSDLSHISRDPLLIYQMSKVGSTSLTYSLEFAYLQRGLGDVKVFHAHTLTNLDLHDQLIRDANGTTQDLALVAEYKRILANFRADPNQHWNVISIVRDPVARHISNYFHHIDRHLPDWKPRWRNGTLTVDQVLQSFLSVEDHAHYWFDSEIKTVVGIDVFASAFPHQRGYSIQQGLPKATLLVIRLEDMDRVAAEAIDQLVGFRHFKPDAFNLGSTASYRGLYEQFKARPLPVEYVEKMYACKFARHFYSDEERCGFVEKWTQVRKPELVCR